MFKVSSKDQNFIINKYLARECNIEFAQWLHDITASDAKDSIPNRISSWKTRFSIFGNAAYNPVWRPLFTPSFCGQESVNIKVKASNRNDGILSIKCIDRSFAMYDRIFCNVISIDHTCVLFTRPDVYEENSSWLGYHSVTWVRNFFIGDHVVVIKGKGNKVDYNNRSRR